MAITSYATLQTEVITHAWRTDDAVFTAAVPTLISGVEAIINYGYGVPGEPDYIAPIRSADMETTATVTLTGGAGTLPTDFIEPRRVKTTVAPARVLEPAAPDWADDQYPSTTGGLPSYYTIVGSTIRAYPVGSGDLSITYYAKVPALSDVVTTNWLLAKSPFVYLYGALMLSEPFMRDDQRMVVWGRMFRSYLAALNHTDLSAKYGGMKSRIRGATP